MAKEMATTEYDAVELAILGKGDLPEEAANSDAVAEDIAARLRGAETAEDIFADDSALGAEDVIGVPLFIRGVRFQASDLEGEGANCYAVISANRGDDGEAIVVTCGGQRVQMQLLQAAKKGLFPMGDAVKFTEHTTGRNRKTFRLVKA